MEQGQEHELRVFRKIRKRARAVPLTTVRTEGLRTAESFNCGVVPSEPERGCWWVGRWAGTSSEAAASSPPPLRSRLGCLTCQLKLQCRRNL